LPFLRPGGVYLCEDVHGVGNPFASHVHGVGHALNDFSQLQSYPEDNERRIVCRASQVQATLGSVHLYPFVAVLERNEETVSEFRAPKRGTQWQPFLG
jgi:hypothetical protein